MALPVLASVVQGQNIVYRQRANIQPCAQGQALRKLRRQHYQEGDTKANVMNNHREWGKVIQKTTRCSSVGSPIGQSKSHCYHTEICTMGYPKNAIDPENAGFFKLFWAHQPANMHQRSSSVRFFAWKPLSHGLNYKVLEFGPQKVVFFFSVASGCPWLVHGIILTARAI